jgi:hypothetical protein
MKKTLVLILGLVTFGSAMVALSQAKDPRMTYHAYMTQKMNKRSNDIQYRIKSQSGERMYRPFSMRYGEIKKSTTQQSYRKSYSITEDKTVMKKIQNEFFSLNIPAIWAERYEDGAFIPVTTGGIEFEAKIIDKKACDNASFSMCSRNIIRTQNTMINSSKRNSRYYRKYPDRIKTYTHNRLADENSLFKFENLGGIYNEKRRYINESRDTMSVLNKQRGFTAQANGAFYEESQIALNMGQEEFIAQRVVIAPNGDLVFIEISAPSNQAEMLIPLTKRIFGSIRF